MRFLVLIVFGLHLSCGQTLQESISNPSPRTLNLRSHCIFRHFYGKYNITCDGNSKHFKDKNLFLDNTFGATGIELFSFESVTIVSKTTSNWEALKKISIRRCKTVIINIDHSLSLGELEIDSVDELTLKTESSGYNFTIKVGIVSNTKKLNFVTDSKNADMEARELYLTNNTDVYIFGNLQLAGDLLTTSQSNIGIASHSTLFLRFASIVTKDSSKLYIEEKSRFNISTDNFLIQESFIYMDGKVNIKGYQDAANRKEIKFLNNTFYGIKENRLEVFGGKNKIEFSGNGFYDCDLGDVLNSLGGNKDVIFKSNNFGCNECAKGKITQTTYLKYLDGNFCYLTCNLSLTEYKQLYDQEIICRKGESYVDEKTLCSTHPRPMIAELHFAFIIRWILVPIAIVSALLFSILTYFFCKRHSPKFQPIPVANTVLPGNMQGVHQEHTREGSRAFSNELYVQYVDDGYEVIDLPSSR